jgi:flagellum-specific peptidoglycan hydrolase FlgJ
MYLISKSRNIAIDRLRHYTIQQLFDYIVKFIVEQGQPAVKTQFGLDTICCFDNGKDQYCAVGCLGVVKERKEKDGMINLNVGVKEFFGESSCHHQKKIAFLNRCREIHDDCSKDKSTFVSVFAARMKQLGQEYTLDCSVII